jgi:hypothetical protein
MRTLRFLPLVILLAMIVVMPNVHAPSNPTFVTYADNATCGAHCTMTQNGGGTFSSDQWGVWGTSSALVVTSGDFLVMGIIDFCISGTADRCDITAVSDGLGNTWTCSTVGNNQIIPGSSVPVIGASVCSSLATHSGTEAATNAFTLTFNCGACTTADANHQWDAEWIVYEYSNAQSILRGTYSTSASAVSQLNAPITTTVNGDAIFGFAWGDSANRPLTYDSSQTNQQAWAGSSGYPAGDLEGLSIGVHDYKIGAVNANNLFEVITAEVSNSVPTPPPPPPAVSGSALAAIGMMGLVTVGLVFAAVSEDPEKRKAMAGLAVAAGIALIILVAAGI